VYFVVHLARKVFELDARILQTTALDVLVWRVRQNLVQSDDITRDLFLKDKNLS